MILPSPCKAVVKIEVFAPSPRPKPWSVGLKAGSLAPTWAKLSAGSNKAQTIDRVNINFFIKGVLQVNFYTMQQWVLYFVS